MTKPLSQLMAQYPNDLAIRLESLALQADLQAMVTANQERVEDQEAMAYVEEDFSEIAKSARQLGELVLFLRKVTPKKKGRA